MNHQIEAYVDQVLAHVDAGGSIKRRLRDDLYTHISDAAGAGASDSDIRSVIARMGEPKEMAAELSELLYDDKQAVVRELIEVKAELRNSGYYEYKSKRTLFGLPLVHIHVSRGYRRGFGYGRLGFGRRPAVAKGIIAIGDIALGGIALGGLAVGGLSVGGLSLGLLSLGGIAIGLLLGMGGIAVGAAGLAFGGMAIGQYAMGGMAIGQYAFGGYAVASRVAIGGFAKGVVAVGAQAEGQYTLATGGNSFNAASVSLEEVRALILSAYPDLSEWLLNLLTWPFRLGR